MFFEKIELEHDEEIIAIIRRHWFFLLKQCLFVVVLAFLPLISVIAVGPFVGTVTAAAVATYTPHIIFLYAFWLLINWMMLALIWTDHYLDTWTITNRRIIKTNQIRLFKRQIGSFRLERLQDLNVEIDGILATLLDYGTIHAETAGHTNEEFKADYLPKPQEIKSTILKAADVRMQTAHTHAL